MRVSVVSVSMCALLGVALVCVGGCGRGDRPDVGLVAGTVTMNGEPLPNAEVLFAPADGRPSMGFTDSSGRYELIHIRDTKGALLGMHQVRITTRQEALPDDYSGPPIQENIPAKYNTETTLTADVKAGENTIDFDLQSP